jgi:hypothetical protein
LSDNDRDLFRFILEVMAAHDAPLLALVGPDRWQIVTAEGVAIAEAEDTPYRAWKGASERANQGVRV